MFTGSKIIVMHITLHGGGASNKIKNRIGSNGPNMFLFGEKKFESLITFHTTIVVLESLLFFSELCFHLLLLNSIHNRLVSQPISGWFSAHIRPVYIYNLNVTHKEEYNININE